jgi:Leucine-rich repeat (LRR) protein
VGNERRNKSFFLKFPEGEYYSVIVDWGNDSVETKTGIGQGAGEYLTLTSLVYTPGAYTVTVIGNNITFLEFKPNYQIKALTLYSCKALEYLDCNNNLLTSLDVSGCKALEYLDCSNNALTSLDVSGCTTLDLLWCENNALTVLDASDCAALRSLSCSNNQISNLNISKNMILSCSHNQL